MPGEHVVPGGKLPIACFPDDYARGARGSIATRIDPRDPVRSSERHFLRRGPECYFCTKNAQIGPPKNSAEKMFGDPFQHTKHLLYIATSLGEDHPPGAAQSPETAPKCAKFCAYLRH